jgi:hypothetical protein
MGRMEPKGMWGRPRPRSDPRLHTPQWRQSREYWKREGKRQEIPCARCGCKINYDAWYIPGVYPRKVYPNAYVLGHVISRDQGRALGYDDQWLDSVENTRPECSRCSARSGYRYQAAKRSQTQASAQQQLARSRGKGTASPQQGTELSPRVITQAAAADRWK